MGSKDAVGGHALRQPTLFSVFRHSIGICLSAAFVVALPCSWTTTEGHHEQSYSAHARQRRRGDSNCRSAHRAGAARMGEGMGAKRAVEAGEGCTAIAAAVEILRAVGG